MKFRCGPSWLERQNLRAVKLLAKVATLQQWHDWFAWWPTRVGPDDCRWLETIQQRYPNAWLGEEYSLFHQETRPVLFYGSIVEYRAK